jgi:hypothetical protein
MPMNEVKNGHTVMLTLTRRSISSRMQTTSCKSPARKEQASLSRAALNLRQNHTRPIHRIG